MIAEKRKLFFSFFSYTIGRHDGSLYTARGFCAKTTA